MQQHARRVVFVLFVLASTLMGLKSYAGQEAKPNTLSKQEKQEGWQLLFDGVTMDQWKSADRDGFPYFAWEIKNGTLSLIDRKAREKTDHADIVTKKQYSNFDFKLEFRINTNDANSGIKYFVIPGTNLGLEYQIYVTDKKIHGPHATADLYDLIAAKGRVLKPNGQWNAARIIVKGKHVEHWLNGVKVVEYERGSKKFRELVAKSKYKHIKGFGEFAQGPILLQDHPGGISFRNIEIRVLK
ncbi:MAG: DUF1080 domain-containing protein [Actinobacteria bacterium]|nr:DUF1080 domain-containing protein [Actinomycetota bacterium]